MTACRQDTRALVAAARQIAEADKTVAGSRAKALKLDLSRVARRAREEADYTRDALKDQVGTSAKNVQRWEDPDDPIAPNAVHIASAPREWALPLLRWQAEQHACEVLESAADQYGDDDGARFSAVVGASANAQRAAVLLVKPGVTATELRRCERDLLRAAEAALEAVQRVRMRLREARGR